MFYSQFILAKKGPLGTIWIAAHLERKLRKNQIADTDIGDSVDSILSPDVPIALRLSSHLLLGVVRIYNKKVNYLFDDCSEALLKIKQAFRSATVDLPPEESKAPYHSITLPETFDLDDFELPDSDIFQGNYVDHHISSKEQITLQDTMEGVNYSTSNFGLDERFGDGDASGLDLDEELLLDKVGSAGDADERAHPHTSFVLISPLKQDEHPEDAAANSETRVDDDGEDDDIMDYAQAPSTPGLVEQLNLSNVRDASACEDHLESEDHLMASAARDNTDDVPYEDKQEVHWCSQNVMVPDVHQGPAQDTEHVSDGLDIEDSKPEGESMIGTHVLPENWIIKEFDDPCQEDSQTEAVKDETKDDNQGPNEIRLDKSALETSGLVDSNAKQTSEGLAVEDVGPLVDVSQSVVDSSVHRKSHNDDSVLGLEDQVESSKEKPEIQVGEETICAPDFYVCNKEVTNEAPVLRPCNSEHPCVTNPVSSMTTDVKSDGPLANFTGEETSLQGQASTVTENSEQNLKENQVEECVSGEEILVSSVEAHDQVHNANSQNKLDENLENSTQLDLPAPEKLLSVPEGHNDLHGNVLAEVSPRDFGELAEVDTGSKTAVGRKRTLTESTLTEQSLNSVESSRKVHAKRIVESVPDDDDLLSSILVGRGSSVLKVKKTPLSEVTSVKRNRTAPRPGPPKRKLLMDDSMVLHGDTIRKQLTSTEDIRRVRKKAPCTFPEISMIQKQHMEDEVFLQPCFTGMSSELVSLHSLVYDFSQIRVCQNDALDASLDIMTKLGQPSQNDECGGALEAKAELNSTFCNDKHGASSEAVAELHLASPSKDIHDLEGDHGTMVVEESGQGLNTEPFILRDNEMAEPNLIPLPTESVVADNHSNVEVNIHQEQSKPSCGIGPDGLEQEYFSESVATEEKSHINLGSENPALAAEVETLDFSGLAIHSTVDAYAVANQRTEMHSVELDYTAVDGERLVSRTEVLEDGGTNKEAETLLAPNNDILQDALDADVAAVTAFDLAQDGNHGEVVCNVQHDNYDMTCGEQREVDFLYPAAHSGLVNSLFDDGERINNPEFNHPNIADTEISGFYMRDEDELNYAAAGDDTEFLNVDDDDLTEMADDYIPDAEEKRYTENSGWSSRTRAVSKYLQTGFTKEAERGRDSLSLGNLLAGKSRKEASRMFFETLVLKTRDYIQVEQNKPFDDITLKPLSRLMKSDF